MAKRCAACYNRSMHDDGHDLAKESQAWAWLDDLSEISEWEQMGSDSCPLGACEIGLPVLLFSNPDCKPGTLARVSIVMIAPLWDFAMGGLADPSFQGYGVSLLGDRCDWQSSMSLQALRARKEGFLSACQEVNVEDSGRPRRPILKPAPTLGPMFGIGSFLAVAAFSRGGDDHARLREGEILEPFASVSSFEPKIKAMMMGRCVSRELSESEFAKVVAGLERPSSRLFGPRAMPWSPPIRGLDGGGDPRKWMQPSWADVAWPFNAPSLAAMRDKFAISLAAGQGAVNNGGKRL